MFLLPFISGDSAIFDTYALITDPLSLLALRCERTARGGETSYLPFPPLSTHRKRRKHYVFQKKKNKKKKKKKENKKKKKKTKKTAPAA